METNETILTRQVVVIDSQKILGSIKALRVDADKRAVSHYIVNNESTGSLLALPFENAIAVGDTYLTVQNREDFLASNDSESNKVLQDGYVLLEEKVFSKTGNDLGTVKSFEFDPARGTVTNLLLASEAIFDSQSFVFFSPDFVFVNDGTPTAADIRSGAEEIAAIDEAPADVVALEEQAIAEEADEPVLSASPVEADIVAEAPIAAEAPVVSEASLEATAEFEAMPVVEAVEAAEPAVFEAEPQADDSITDEEIMEFLIGATLQADVASDDGIFMAPKGTVLTREIIVEASAHDAILLLTINVDV